MDQQDNQQPQQQAQPQVMDIQAPQPAPAEATPVAQSPPPAPAPDAKDDLKENPLAIKQPAPAKPKQPRGPIGIIIVAILVAIGLGFLAVTLYQKGNAKPSATGTPSTSEQTQQGTTPAADIDNTTSEIDKSLESVDESQDFNDNDLSDSNLGL